MKYLHLIDGKDQFISDYNDDGGIKTFTCSAGTFTYKAYDGDGNAYLWENGNIELATPNRLPVVGPFNYESGTGAFDFNNNSPVEILSVGEVQEGKYRKPWTSVTDYQVPTKFTAHIMRMSVSSSIICFHRMNC